MDAYQLAAVRARDSGSAIPTRPSVYAQWLDERLGSGRGRGQAVSLVTGAVREDAYRSVRLLRRTGKRRGRRRNRWLTRPDVCFAGVPRVSEPEQMAELLAGGVGRHSGFGFGMLLLRPA